MLAVLYTQPDNKGATGAALDGTVKVEMTFNGTAYVCEGTFFGTKIFSVEFRNNGTDNPESSHPNFALIPAKKDGARWALKYNAASVAETLFGVL